MKTKLVAICCLLSAVCLPAFAQGTAFTYQGRLNDVANPASGIYDLRFTVYTVNSGGSALAGPLTNAAIAVNDGLFTVTLDFGTGVFTGPDRWLEIGVRSNGVGAFIALTPRQAFTATPYATYAKGASAAGITGTLPASSLFGTYTSPLTFNNGANSFSGSFYGQFFGTSFIGGSFAGDGGGLINLNASQITEGDFPASSLENAWRIIGNSNTSPANFIGTTDNQALEIRVNNVRGLRIEPDPRPGNSSANIIGGSPSNLIELPGSGGSAIVGGGFPGGGNVIRSNSSGVFIGAGSVNEAGPNANDVVIAGGYGNIARSSVATISGGAFNQVQTNSDNATIGGGNGNAIHSNSGYSTIAGGAQNEIQVGAGFSAIGGGWLNRIEVTADQSAIAGGNANQVHPGSRESFIGGGFANQIRSNAYNGVIGGGSQNVITNAGVATIGGGVGNTNMGYAATVAGGFFNTAANNGAAVGGGGQNAALGFNSVVAGGNNNIATAENSAIGGGYQNTNSGFNSTIGGGYRNQATNAYATVPGGALNLAGGQQSFAAGTFAKAIHNGAFVWGDATGADFPSIVDNEFAVRASGGIRFATAGAGITLDGIPVLTAGSTLALTLNNPANSFVGTFNGDGAGLTNLNAWELDGNTVSPGQFLGSVNNQNVELRVNNQRRLLLDTNANVVAGNSSSAIGPTSVNLSGVLSGSGNQIRATSSSSVIAGGSNNAITNGTYASISGGLANYATGFGATVGGGTGNSAVSDRATASGGAGNQAGGDSSFIGGGIDNVALNGGASIVGGSRNTNSSAFGFIGGGQSNSIIGVASGAVIVGGLNNNAFGARVSVGGGENNTILGANYATIPGGLQNNVSGDYGFAAGRRAKANHQGAFVWADSQDADITSTGNNQFLVRAAGGVGINTNNPGSAALAVNGNIATSGGLSFSDPTKSITFPAVAGANQPMLNMFASGTGNATRMVIAHSPGFPSFGLQYADVGDQFEFLGGGISVMSIGLISGNVGIGTNNPISKLHVIGGATFSSGAAGANQSVSWSPGSASWSFTSDRNAKDRVTPVNPESVLEKVARIPINEWSYIGYDQRHIGPMAQDFHAQFPLNPNDKALNDADLHGVALAAIQGLNRKLVERDSEIQSLKSELEQLKNVVNKLANAKE